METKVELEAGVMTLERLRNELVTLASIAREVGKLEDDIIERADAMGHVLAGMRGHLSAPAQPATLLEEIASVLNRHSAENASDTPDFILAEYLVSCLASFAVTARARDKWYGLQGVCRGVGVDSIEPPRPPPGG